MLTKLYFWKKFLFSSISSICTNDGCRNEYSVFIICDHVHIKGPRQKFEK